MADLSLDNIMKEAKKMQEMMQTTQQQLADIRVTGEAGAGLVKVEMNGRHDAISVTIDDSLMKESKIMLQDLIGSAINAAVKNVEKKAKEKLGELTAHLNIPKELQSKEDED